MHAADLLQVFRENRQNLRARRQPRLAQDRDGPGCAQQPRNLVQVLTRGHDRGRESYLRLIALESRGRATKESGQCDKMRVDRVR